MCCVTSVCISLASSPPASQYPAASLTKASPRRWTGALSPAHHIQICPTRPCVALSAGLGEKPSSQLVCCPGPSVSGFPALCNLNIRAEYICHSPFSGDCEMSRAFQTSAEKKCCVTPSRGLGLSRCGRAGPETSSSV